MGGRGSKSKKPAASAASAAPAAAAAPPAPSVRAMTDAEFDALKPGVDVKYRLPDGTIKQGKMTSWGFGGIMVNEGGKGRRVTRSMALK